MVAGRMCSKLSPRGKYFLLITAILCFALAVINVDIMNSIWLDDNFSDSSTDDRFSFDILREDVTVCLTKLKQGVQDTNPFERDDRKMFDRIPSPDGTKNEPTIFTLLTSFNNLLSLLHVKAVIIEPSILHCMLLPKYQEILLKRSFNLFDFFGSKNIVTYGILERDVPILQKEENIYKFTGIDFQPHFVQAPMEDWMQRQDTHFEFETFPSHMFYKHRLFTVHLVVFHDRGGYFWHAGMPSWNNNKIPPRDELLFVDYNGGYEKFSFLSLENKILPIADFYVPSNAHYFLFEMPSSHFLECNLTRAANVFSTGQPKSHPGMSVNRFNRRTRIVIRELKKIFHPLLMNLWIWSGTMLGWYRQCDIIPYTTDVDFASWASEVDDLDHIINLLLNNKYLTIRQRMGILKEALEFQIDCHNLRADIFFMYRIHNGTWCSGHSPKLGYYFRYYYPPFTLCSAELLEEKVQVPCETEDVIVSEYGSDWSKPISSWHYETSIKNRGPTIYWEKKQLKDAYQVY